ncbi:hypothetical protein CBS147326_2266 [Penicillium roqueforti]|nr:hypothetical protein CBS147326_2266 [Penicillium roqueforti]
MMVQSCLMWLVHVLPAVALTITAPSQTIPSLAPLLSCASENLIEDVAFETIDLDDSVWTVLPPTAGAVVDGYLHLSAEAIQSQALLIQTVTGAVAEETYSVSFDFRLTAGSCTVDLVLNGANVGVSTLTAGSWQTITKQWTAVSSEADMLILISCPGATILGATVDVNNFSFEKRCGSFTSTSVSVPTKTPSGSPVATSTPLASSVSPSGHSSSEGSGSSSLSSVSPSSTVGPITLTTPITASSGAIKPSASTPGAPAFSQSTAPTTAASVKPASSSPAGTPTPHSTTTITGPVNPASSSVIESSASTPGIPEFSETTAPTTVASVKPTSSSPAETPTPDMTTSTVFTTRTATIKACPSTITNCPATDKTTHITTETIIVSTTVCPVGDATTTTDGSSPTSLSGSDNDYTISTILSTRTVTLTQCPETVTDCPARDQTTHVTTETIVAGTTSVPINTAVATTTPGAVHTSTVPVQTATAVLSSDTKTSTAYSVVTITGTATSEESSPTSLSGSDNDYTISTILSTRTVTLTQCPETVTDCPARDQTTHVTTETIVAGTTLVPINTAVTTTASGAVYTSTVPVQTATAVVSSETRISTDYSIVTVTGTATTEGGVISETSVSRVGESGPGSGVSANQGEGEDEDSTGSGSGSGSGSDISAGSNTGHPSNLPGITLTRISSATPSISAGIHSATAKVSPAAASSPTAATGTGAGASTGSGSTTESSSSASASPVFNRASSSTVSGALSALGVIAAVALFL